MQGWVSIHRKIMNNPVWQDPKLLKLWMLCLLEASHKEHDQLVGRQMVRLQPGQFVTGRYALANSYNEGAKKSDIVPESTLWRWMKWLEQNEFVNIKSNTKYSVVTIVNWNSYQQSEQQNEQQMNIKNDRSKAPFAINEQKSKQQKYEENPYISIDSEVTPSENEQQMDSKWTANEQQVNTNNNGNKGNNENKKETTTTTENPVVLFEKSLCRLSSIQTEKLYQWVDDFNGQTEIINAAIKLADDRNKRNFGFVEYLLKEWANNNLTSLDRVRAYEQEKFNKTKPISNYRKKQTRSEILPDWFNEDESKSNQGNLTTPTPEQIERNKRDIEEKLKKLRA